jgi:tetratricopeptide (TPR) repeat protein
VRMEQSRLEELRPALQEIAAAHPENGVYLSLLARLECEAGNDAAAGAMLELLARDQWATVRRNIESLLAMALLAETAALLAHEEHAAELDHLLAPYGSRIAVAGHFFPMGAMSRYMGMLAAVLSRFDEAARRFEDAAATNAAIGARPWVAHAKADHARVLLIQQAPGDRERARGLLREALAIHEQLGMTASADRIAALLGETGGPPPRGASSGPPRSVARRPT